MVARPKFKVTLPDIEYYREQILCQWACPINTGAGRYVCEIASSNYEEAYSIARSPNPLVYSLGRVCGHPCETACRRGHIDEPISIRALKRTATDHHDQSKGHHSKIVKAEKKDEKRSSDGRFIDHGDTTITDTKSGMMWTKKDSYADLGKCLDWNDSTDYVSKLRVGGYSDWRVPAISELKTIYEESKSNNLTYDHNPKVLLHLDSVFADGAAYWYWSSETADSCCAREFHFNSGKVDGDPRESCNDRGVRAVRLGR
tara:strand:+ start:5863 stop:6636 length:774 start_codon:yes stop_codon:yes gene_type:complete